MGEELGLQVEVRGKLGSLRAKLVRFADRSWLHKREDGKFTSEVTACRHDEPTARLRKAGLGAIPDLGFVGLDDSGPDADPAVITGYETAGNRPLTRGQRLSNKALAAGRARASTASPT
ncbi:hypothetical protein [Streptomyces sp. MA15]|uniref:hypothetical protein n=1 Tax=Streptomyces sp. MA15 TaxID=3055061 RepID=UPI0025B1A9BE|nr:hypothetical protein [Streptomyces sp. MA15]MDN3267032.1 hypothetical protein [Streptomyces sp. MA15]